MIQQHKQTIQEYCKENYLYINDTDFKLFELLRNFIENDWLIDEITAKIIQNSEITAVIHSNKSMEVLEFLRSLNIARINNLRLTFTEEFTEADLDLIGMTDMDLIGKKDMDCSLLNIFLEKSSSSMISISTSSTRLSLSMEKKQIVPNFLKSSFKSFSFHYIETQEEEEEEMLDNLFFTLSDLIEHILGNHGHKELILLKSTSKRSDLYGRLLYGRLVQKIRSLFGQRENFENILIKRFY